MTLKQTIQDLNDRLDVMETKKPEDEPRASQAPQEPRWWLAAQAPAGRQR